MNSWFNCKKILCVRLDNMGDVLMSAPAMQALKETFRAHITLLTSSVGAAIAQFIPGIDDVISYDVPWVKHKDRSAGARIAEVVEVIAKRKFDAAVVFTTFSQSCLPAAMMLYDAEIPLRLAYCRENPYDLLTHWLPEKEPYTMLRHQVRRDLDLVSTIGARIRDERIPLNVDFSQWREIAIQLDHAGFDTDRRWLLFHPGVSEGKREFPTQRWIDAGKEIVREGFQIVCSGSAGEATLCSEICAGIGSNAFSLAGKLTLAQFITLIAQTPLVVSVNTSTIHIASATYTPVIVLYALTNPQHGPWRTNGKLLPFDVNPEIRSKNEILVYTREKYYPAHIQEITAADILKAVKEVVDQKNPVPLIEEIVTLQSPS